MDCKKALIDSGGDVEAATLCLREKGLLNVQARAGRAANEGLIEAYVHGGGRIGVLVEVNCETDFVAKNEEFKQFVHNIAIHVAAASPQYVRVEDVPDAALKEVPEFKRDEFLTSACLLEQPYIREESVTIGQLVTDLIAKIGENIKISRFARFQLGQGDKG